MNVFLLRLGRPIALCLSCFVTAQMTAAALPLQQDQNQQPTPAQQTQPATPDSQSAQQPAQQPATDQQAQPAAPAQQPDAPAPGFASRSQDGQNVEQQDAQKPVGTAAGPLTRPTGVAGSRPSGAAIAPAKQKRAMAIFIRVGLIVAGAAAAGAVIGLSKGSPSHPQ